MSLCSTCLGILMITSTELGVRLVEWMDRPRSCAGSVFSTWLRLPFSIVFSDWEEKEKACVWDLMEFFLISLQPAVRVRQSASLSTLIVFQIWQRPVLSSKQRENPMCKTSKAQNLSENILAAHLSTLCVLICVFHQDHSAHSASINSWP